LEIDAMRNREKNVSSSLKRAYQNISKVLAVNGNNERHAFRTKTVSKATQKARYLCMRAMFRDLHSEGYLLEEVGNLKRKHLMVLAKIWERRGTGPSQIQKMCSIVRVVTSWLGKENIVPRYEEMFSDPRFYRRTYVATQEKSWDSAGINLQEILAQIAETDAHVAIQVLLISAFGLRIQEAQRFHPVEGDLFNKIRVCWGAKNGRPRDVEFTQDKCEFQRAVLNLAKAFVNPTTGSTIPKEYSAIQWYWHFNYIVRKYGGVTKQQSGITMHGLRHQFLNELYESSSGLERPLRRLRELSPDQKKFDEYGRQMVALAAGHSRTQISTAYIGR